MLARRDLLFVSACLALLGACAPQAVPATEPSLPPPLVPEALAAWAAEEVAFAALSFVRFASLVGVFIEDSGDLYLDIPPADEASHHAEHALLQLAGCTGASVVHDEGSPDVLVEFGPDCFSASTGAHLEGRLQLSVLEEAGTILGTGPERVARLVFAGALVDGLALSGTIDSGVLGVVSAGAVAPFSAYALGRFNLDSNTAILITSGGGWFIGWPYAEPVLIGERACRYYAAGFQLEQVETDANACTVTAGTVSATWALSCADASAPGELVDVKVGARLPLAPAGPVDVELVIEGEPAGTYPMDLAQLPVDARCL